MNTENLSTPGTKTWKIGIAANVMFLVFLLLPMVSVNGKTMHSTRSYLIWIAAVVALILRIRKKEKATAVISFVSLILCIIVYTMLAVGLYGVIGGSVKVHIITALLLLISSAIMIKPSLLGEKLEH
ncbi:MAG: hypothetical protein NC307_09845 [Roseburia sp.]|nr:hypothetical protein [Roseburia sp.]